MNAKYNERQEPGLLMIRHFVQRPYPRLSLQSKI